MKAITNLFFLILLLLSLPAFLYYLYTKTYAAKEAEQSGSSTPPIPKIIQIKDAEIDQLRKENAELKARVTRPLAQPPRRFGQGGQGIESSNSNSNSPLAQPPRQVGQAPTSSDRDVQATAPSDRVVRAPASSEFDRDKKIGLINHPIIPADLLHE